MTSCVAYLVIGTESPAAITFTPARARSAGDAIFAGLAVGTITVSRFVAKGTAVPLASPLSTSFWGFAVSADRKTSAGAPCSIWVSSAADESVDVVSVTPGWDEAYAVFTFSSTPFSDAAPKTVSSTVAPFADDAEPVEESAFELAPFVAGCWLADGPPLAVQAVRTIARPTRIAGPTRIS